MKSAALAILFSGLMCAQTTPGVQASPGTPAIGAPPNAPAAAQPAAEITPDTVVMEADGKKYTKAEVDQLFAMLPAQYQTQAHAQPQFLTQLLMLQKLTDDAVKEGIEKRSPYKEQLELQRLQILGNAELTIHGNSFPMTETDQEKYYKEHADKFQDAKVRVIYIAFNPAPDKTGADAKKLLLEPEAKAKIEDLRKQIEGGADFGKLARENSDDKTSAGKDGDFGIIKRTSPYPDPIKNAVFALKPGELSQPIKQPNGYYLIRLEELNTVPYDEVKSQIVTDIRTEKFKAWTDDLRKQFTIKVVEPAYFAPKAPPAQLQQVR